MCKSLPFLFVLSFSLFVLRLYRQCQGLQTCFACVRTFRLNTKAYYRQKPIGISLPHRLLSHLLHVFFFFGGTYNLYEPLPIRPMYGIYTYIWLIFLVHLGKYTIHRSQWLISPTHTTWRFLRIYHVAISRVTPFNDLPGLQQPGRKLKMVKVSWVINHTRWAPDPVT